MKREREREWKIEQEKGGTQGVLLGWSQRKQRGGFSPPFRGERERGKPHTLLENHTEEKEENKDWKRGEEILKKKKRKNKEGEGWGGRI